jgi:AcrR family transcriptional regulator
MDDIGQTADLSKGTVYLYFKSNEDLFYAICENNLKVIKEQLSKIFATTKENLLSDPEQFYDNLQKLEKKERKKYFLNHHVRQICSEYYMNKGQKYLLLLRST